MFFVRLARRAAYTFCVTADNEHLFPAISAAEFPADDWVPPLAFFAIFPVVLLILLERNTTPQADGIPLTMEHHIVVPDTPEVCYLQRHRTVRLQT